VTHVNCGLWKAVPLFNGCAKFLNLGGNWNMSYTSTQSIPNMLNGRDVWRVCRPWKNWDIFSFQELCTDPCEMRLCIVLKHEVMAGDEGHKNAPQDLVTVSLCTQIAIDKIK
jgi:hypothetical protein